MDCCTFHAVFVLMVEPHQRSPTPYIALSSSHFSSLQIENPSPSRWKCHRCPQVSILRPCRPWRWSSPRAPRLLYILCPGNPQVPAPTLGHVSSWLSLLSSLEVFWLASTFSNTTGLTPSSAVDMSRCEEHRPKRSASTPMRKVRQVRWSLSAGLKSMCESCGGSAKG